MAGNLFTAGAYMSIEDALVSHARQTGRNPLNKETTMDAKYNWLIDNGAVRVTLNTVAFALWVATAIALLEFATKL
jgi:hypothetical protein